MTAILLAAAVGLAVTLLGTPIAIRLFRAWGWGQRIREDGPHTHMEKMGTPTMGGIVILAGVVCAYLVTRLLFSGFTAMGLSLVVVAIGFGFVGFLDDFIKVTRQRSLGLGKAAKLGATAAVALAFAFVASHYRDSSGTSTDLSFIRQTGVHLGIVFFIWVLFVLTASSNAVNITDGLDGLASGSSILVLAAYVFIAFWQFRHTCVQLDFAAACYPVSGDTMLDIGIATAGMMGSIAGFLWWNAAPARIFMGDTGSLAIGGFLGGLAVATNTQLLLVILGGLFVMETMSVILQVIAFRGFGRRIFRMSPIHHHFQLLGWAESKITIRFWIVAIMLALVSLSTLKLQ